MYFCYFLLFGLELQQVFITVEHSELLYPGVSTGHKEQYTIFVWAGNASSKLLGTSTLPQLSEFTTSE